MKKLIVLLLSIAMVGAVFAQEAAPVTPKVSGYFYASVNAVDVETPKGGSASWDQNLGDGQYATVGLSYTEKAYGFSGTVEFYNDAINSKFRDYTVWAKPFGDIAKLSAGKLRNGDYRLTSVVDGAGFNTRIANAEYGIMAQVYPIKGLSIGVFDWIDSTGVATTATFDNLNFGASYSLEGIGKFVGAAKRNTVIVNSTTPTTVLTDEYFLGFDLKAVEGLTARAGVTFDLTANKGGAKNNSWTKVWLTGGYDIADIGLGIDASYLKNSGTTLHGKASVSYNALEAFTPSAYFYVDKVNGYVANTTKADGTTPLTTADSHIDGTDYGFGASIAIPAGAATVYAGFDYSILNTDSVDAGTSLVFPIAIEVSF